MVDFGRDVSFLRDNNLFRLRSCAVILHDEKVLMAKNIEDSWYYSIGGAVEFGESLEDAVRREVLEECGVELEIDRLLVVHQNFFQGDDGHDWHEIAFYFLMDTSSVSDWSALVRHESYCMSGVPEGKEWLEIGHYAEEEAYPVFFKDIREILKAETPRSEETRLNSSH